MCSGEGWALWGGPVTEKGSSEVAETGNMEIRTGKLCVGIELRTRE